MKKNYIIPETKTHQLRTVKVIAASDPLGYGGTADGSEVLGRSYDFDDDDDYDY